MARVEIASQAWGTLTEPPSNRLLPFTSATLKNLDGTNATTWSAVTGGTSSTAALTSNSDGTLPRFVEDGTYDLTVGATTRRVEAAGGVPGQQNVKRFGAVGDGSADDTAAIQAAISALGQSGTARGGTLVFPKGVYKVSSLLDLDSAQNVIMRGEGSNSAYQASRLVWTGGAGSGPMIRCRAADGLRLEGLKLVYTNAAYNGDLLDTGTVAAVPTTNLILRDCYLGGDGVAGAASLLNLDGAVDVRAENTSFGAAVLGIVGGVAEFAINVSLETCYFNGATTASIKNMGHAWGVHNCSFERLAGGTAGAITHDHGTGVSRARGCSIRNCWFGDVTSNSGTWIDLHCYGLEIVANVFDQRTFNAVKAVSLYDCDGVIVMGNNFREGSHGVEQAGSTLRGFVAMGNSFESVTNPLPNTSATARAISIANIGYDGFIDMVESGDHTAPAANRVRLYSKDNGSGKTVFAARFNTGAVQAPATEP